MNKNLLRTTGEKILTPIAFITSGGFWILLLGGTAYATWIEPVTLAFTSAFITYAAFIIGFLYIINALMMAQIRLNGIRLSPTQYPEFYKIYEQTARELGLTKVPNAYIIQLGGELNAFAVKICGKKMIVFFSDLIETLVENDQLAQLKAVAAHELTHVRLKHVNYWIFLLPFSLVPFLGKMLTRYREYSADRGSFHMCKHTPDVSRALIKLASGKMVGNLVNEDEYAKQPETEKGIFIWLAKMMATHPPIPYRIKAIRKLERNHNT